MKYKRLRHHVQNFGQKFCGWELMFDYKKLAALSSGTLEFDFLNGITLFNGKQNATFSSAEGVRTWMLDDLKGNQIKLSDIQSAVLIVRFETKRELQQSDKSTSWRNPEPYFIKCKIECESFLEAGNRKLTSSYVDFHEWPEGYSCN